MSTHWPTFDELLALAENAPDELEEFRLREITKIIESAPEHLRQRLRGLQFQVNCQMQLHQSPMGKCMAISRMMHESLAKLNDALHGQHKVEAEEVPQNVVPFEFAASLA